MSDPVTITCHPATGINGWTSTFTIPITPDLARQIVALAASPTTTTPPADTLPADTSDQDAAITALARILAFAHYSTQAVEVLAAIKAGKVPGMCMTADAQDALSAEREAHAREVATVTAERDRLAHERLQITKAYGVSRRTTEQTLIDMCNARVQEWQDRLAAVTAERDTALAECERLRHKYKDKPTGEVRVCGLTIRQILDMMARDEKHANDFATVTAERDRLAGLLRKAKQKGGILRNGVRQVAANGPPSKDWREQGEQFAADWDKFEDRIDAALAELESHP